MTYTSLFKDEDYVDFFEAYDEMVSEVIGDMERYNEMPEAA